MMLAVGGSIGGPSVAYAAPLMDAYPSPHWFLGQMWRLEKSHGPRHAYQMGMIGVALYPSFSPLRAALIHAAIRADRCVLAVPHLRVLGDQTLSKTLAQWRRGSERLCLGGWRNNLQISGSAQRRKSLGPGNGITRFAAEPGSLLFGICTLLQGVCDPGALTSNRPQSRSGFDSWFTASVTSRRLYAGHARTLQARLIRRVVHQGYFGAEGADISYAMSKFVTNRRSLLWNLQAQTMRIDRDTPLADHQQSMLAMTIGVNRRHTHTHQSTMRLTHRHHMISAASHHVTLLTWGMHTRLSTDAILEWSVETGSKTFTTSNRARTSHLDAMITGLRVMVRAPPTWRVVPWLGVMQRHYRYRGQLAYLARPHSDWHRKFEVGVSVALGAADQGTVALIAYHDEVRSPDILVARKTTGLSLQFSYQLMEDH